MWYMHIITWSDGSKSAQGPYREPSLGRHESDRTKSDYSYSNKEFVSSEWLEYDPDEFATFACECLRELFTK